MCLILFAYDAHPQYRLVMAANRDEFYDRPTAPLQFWQDQPQVLAGRDLMQLGTWMGITPGGRLAAVTNYRDPLAVKPDAPSRGDLVSDFLTGRMASVEYLEKIKVKADAYNGFNLIVGDPDGLFYYGNRGEEIKSLGPGFYGLSNHLLNTPWPKVQSGISRLQSLLQNGDKPSFSRLYELMQNQDKVPDDELPDTGVGPEWERMLGSIFISSPNYGTRCSSILTIDYAGQVRFKEITWQPAQPKPCRSDEREFSFALSLQ